MHSSYSLSELLSYSQNGWTAEFGSAFYVAYKLWPSRMSQLLYVIMMTASNVSALLVTYKIAQMPIPSAFILPYVCLAIMIVGLRAAAQVFEGQIWLSQSPKAKTA